MNTGQRDGFSSKFGVFAAATGSAIGLGNIWRFPYVVGENGGAAFLLIYLGFVFLIGIPVMLSEFTIGRKAQLNAYGSFKKLAPGKPWYIVGLMGIVAAFTILAFYSTVAGWTLEYVYQSFVNLFANRGETNPANVFNEFHTGTTRPLLWQLLFMVLTAGIILGGVKKGIEKYSKILMPVLFLILVILCVRSLTLPGAAEGLAFLFRPDFTKINADVILNITANTNPEASELGSRDSVAAAYETKATATGFFSSMKLLISWIVVGEMGKMLLAVFGGIVGFLSVYFIVKWIRNGI